MEILETIPTVTSRFGMKKTDMTEDQWNVEAQPRKHPRNSQEQRHKEISVK